MPRKCENYEQYIDRIETRMLGDLMKMYPKADISEGDALWDAFTLIYDAYDSMQFIFVLDEWDFLFHRDFVKDKDKREYISFLRNLLKDKVGLYDRDTAIAKYSSGSELNMFAEYTMESEEMYSDCFGFTGLEVDELYERYLKEQPIPNVTREGLKEW